MKFIVAIALVGVPACSGFSDLDSNTSSVTYALNTTIKRPEEDPLLALAAKVGAFAGYYCEDGDVVVGLAGTDDATSKSVLTAAIADDDTPSACYNRDIGARTPQVRFVQKKYSFLTLRSWRDTIGDAFFDGGGHG